MLKRVAESPRKVDSMLARDRVEGGIVAVDRRIAFVSVGKVAEALGVSPPTVRNWIAKGYVHAIRLPSGVRRIPETEVHRLVSEVFGRDMDETGPAPRVRLRPEATEEDPFPAV